MDLTLPTPAENLACDEALLDAAEEGQGGEVLRFWEPQNYFVVLGYTDRTSQEVDLEACRARGVAVFRRCSGGGAVLQGPGCLNYSLVLKIEGTGPLADVSSTNRFILGRHAEALTTLMGERARYSGENTPSQVVPCAPEPQQERRSPTRHDLKLATRRVGDRRSKGEVHGEGGGEGHSRSESSLMGSSAPLVQIQGHTDLTLGNLKFSGNSQRRKRLYLLFHGTFLLDFDLSLVAALLRVPSRQPAYRRNRSHEEFCANLGLAANRLKSALRMAWNARQTMKEIPVNAISKLVSEKYSRMEWTLKFS